MAYKKESAERPLRAAESYRSGLVFKLSLVDTTGSLRRQLGVEVLDDVDRIAEVSAQRLEQLGREYAESALQATLGMPGAPNANAPDVMTNQPYVQEGPAFRPLPGFSTEVPMTPLDQAQQN